MKQGYTIIELLIVITIIGLTLSLGTSAFSSARDRQAARADAEKVLSVLQDAKKKASIGDRDGACTGKLIGYFVLLNTKTVTVIPDCQTTNGPATITTISSTIDPSTSFSFRTLDGSTTLDVAGTSFTLTGGGVVSTFTISQAGAVTYVQN